MDATIETERLTLRTFVPHDADFMFELFSRPEVARWSGQGVPMQHRDEAVARIARQPERVGDHPATAIFAVLPRGTATPIGMAMLVPIPGSEGFARDDFEIGWHFHPDAWGNGYATEAAHAALGWGLRERALPEVLSFTAAINLRSRAVMERVGLRHVPDGDFEHPAVPVGHPVRPHVLYRLPESPC